MIINQTGGGAQPTGTTQITSNGTHNVAGYEFADVQVPTTAPAHYIEKVDDGTGKLVNSTTMIDLTGITEIGDYALMNAYNYNTQITNNVDMSMINNINQYGLYGCFQYSSIPSIDLSGIENIDKQYSFYICFNFSNIQSFNLSRLETITGNNACYKMFTHSKVVTANLPELKTISGSSSFDSCFSDCTNMIDFYADKLETASSLNNICENCTNLTLFSVKSLQKATLKNALRKCTSLLEQKFQSLTDIKSTGSMQYCFYQDSLLQTVWFYALDSNSFGSYTNQFDNMLTGCSNVTVHFPMRIQSTIGSWTSVTAGFGGTNTTVLFDIVCTLTGADSNIYTRQQKDSTSTATAWDLGGVLYYTTGTAEPVVNDTIYSDAGCTTPVTTVSAIA